MKDYESTEIAYKNGYALGKKDALKHGRWEEVIGKGIFGKRYLRCSNCESENGLMIHFNYCPNCGAKMDLEG